jgi:hypothetical protein
MDCEDVPTRELRLGSISFRENSRIEESHTAPGLRLGVESSHAPGPSLAAIVANVAGQ